MACSGLQGEIRIFDKRNAELLLLAFVVPEPGQLHIAAAVVGVAVLAGSLGIRFSGELGPRLFVRFRKCLPHRRHVAPDLAAHGREDVGELLERAFGVFGEPVVEDDLHVVDRHGAQRAAEHGLSGRVVEDLSRNVHGRIAHAGIRTLVGEHRLLA